jgi:hypothetical protein
VPYVPVPIAPDPARDARVAARRADDARRAGRALDRLSNPRVHVGEAYNLGWQDGYAASELHHNRHYGAPAGSDDHECNIDPVDGRCLVYGHPGPPHPTCKDVSSNPSFRDYVCGAECPRG